MKVGIIGVGFVGTSCAKSMMLRGSCSEIVLIDLAERLRHTHGVRNDLSHGEPLCPSVRLTVGGYEDLRDASVVVLTAGINEKAGRAIDRADPWGRQRLLPENSRVFGEVVPRIVAESQGAPILVVTDPPDSLADVARGEVAKCGGSNRIVSTGTFLDTLRFRIQLGRQFDCSPRTVEAYVLGEHGKTQVYAWSSVRICGVAFPELVRARGLDLSASKSAVERAVIDANIDIIDATEASQHGIGIVTTRIVEAMLRDERVVLPVGSSHPKLGVTLSLPSTVGSNGVIETLPISTPTSEDQLRELHALHSSAAYIAEALERSRKGLGFDRPPSLTWSEWSRRAGLA